MFRLFDISSPIFGMGSQRHLAGSENRRRPFPVAA
jgi:hypothetical protein